MAIEEELTADLVDGYRKAGEEVGYWGRRFLQSVHRNGGVATVKRMLSPRTKGQRVGLDALLEAGRPDLTVEAIILKSKYRVLFTPEELKVAAERLGECGKEARNRIKAREHLYPDELEPGKKYIEGARKQVKVNAFERNSRARKACVNHYGCRCVACGVSFEEKYGEIGKGFIHVHHLKPLSLTVAEYQLDPIADLRPVCPNCHAMLHRSNDVVISVEELITRMSKNNA